MEEEEGEDVEAKGQCEPRLRVAEEHGTLQEVPSGWSIGFLRKEGSRGGCGCGETTWGGVGSFLIP